MTVNNYQNEGLGKVEDLAVDLESGRIVQVILSTGGFIGIGDVINQEALSQIEQSARRPKLEKAGQITRE